MVRRVNVSGYEAVKAAIDSEKNHSGPIFVLFTGSKNAKGESWCPDCVKAEPFIEEVLHSNRSELLFIQCDVGNRNFWKDQNNAFRKDNFLKLTGVPTLLKIKENKRLQEEQLFNKDLVAMLFEED
ncbi:Thioredoxin domain-containing protein 17 [Nymphon striatum]|nr:Thioredoxin domain-containing protein 17 [Nymphon striatum]